MMTELLTAFLKNVGPALDEGLIEEYASHFTPREYPKKAVITAAGEVQKEWLFIESGIQKSYFLHEGKYHVMAFTYPPSFSGIPESFFSQSPSRFFLETITDTKLWRIPYAKHMAMLEKHRPIERMCRIFTEQVLSGIVYRHHELMAYDIETRLKNFLQRSPHLLNQIPHKDLASYLRIDPSNFSKLLNQVKILV